MPDRCCGTSIGVLIIDLQGRLLMIERGWYPIGIAPVAGHIADAHTSPEEALLAEVREEVGLTVTSHAMVWSGWLPNLCAGRPAALPGHRWVVGRAAVTGELAPDPTETRGAAWYTRQAVGALAARTLDYARGGLTDAEFAARPGLEPVWLELLHVTRRLPLTLSPHELALVRRLYTTPPERYWAGGRLVDAATLARDLATAP
ncbi:8-oxo-dGTP pyrophosphatase MutT (NUDIX family) [Streptomonospora nanhaiensis]|uniref:8-oxo-dGTP pyrophosphatase MutT (NUDIX family) n=1 Tax=Streptomonospora nanhaiensis TaxID=1323731 RepID=A0A853BWD2_9ACTN|nr:NUDIX hydrolase [Streptomonospora nanhaiensis]NYI99290.1 8-oxo-dGTP pyrophosphatase MutT (NUDIX family) [Streptomonospora nanhaiensis]